MTVVNSAVERSLRASDQAQGEVYSTGEEVFPPAEQVRAIGSIQAHLLEVIEAVAARVEEIAPKVEENSQALSDMGTAAQILRLAALPPGRPRVPRAVAPRGRDRHGLHALPGA